MQSANSINLLMAHNYIMAIWCEVWEIKCFLFIYIVSCKMLVSNKISIIMRLDCSLGGIFIVILMLCLHFQLLRKNSSFIMAIFFISFVRYIMFTDMFETWFKNQSSFRKIFLSLLRVRWKKRYGIRIFTTAHLSLPLMHRLTFWTAECQAHLQPLINLSCNSQRCVQSPAY